MSSSTIPTPPGVQLRGELAPAFPEIVSPEALAFVAKLQRAFGNRREECLKRRQDRQAALDRGEALDFLPETKSIREERLDLRTDSGGFARSAGRDHRADRSQDGDQCAQFRRKGFHGRFRRREFADVGEHG